MSWTVSLNVQGFTSSTVELGVPENSRLENAGLENEAPNCRTGICRSLNCGTKLQSRNSRELDSMFFYYTIDLADTVGIVDKLIRLSSMALLHNLNWLPIAWRIRFKLATLAYKALHTGQPPYLAQLNCYNSINPYDLCDLPLLFCSLFHDAILSLARVPFESLRQRFGTHSLPIFVMLHHSLLFVGISKYTIFS